MPLDVWEGDPQACWAPWGKLPTRTA